MNFLKISSLFPQNQLISNFHFPHTFGSTLGNPILTLSCNLSDTPWFYRMRQLAGKWTGVTAGFVV